MRKSSLIASAACLASVFAVLVFAGEEPVESAQPHLDAVTTDDVGEARLRSRLLHETIHGSLQVMHRDYFRENERQPIPSESLEDVFADLEKAWGVKMKWMAVNAKPMNAEHRAETAFDKRAVEAISSGSEMFETSADGVYQYAGRIVLGNQCLKCHVPGRTSLEDRKAAVVISMPLKLRPLNEK